MRSGHGFHDDKEYKPKGDQEVHEELRKLTYLIERITKPCFMSPQCTIHCITNPFQERFEKALGPLIRSYVAKELCCKRSCR